MSDKLENIPADNNPGKIVIRNEFSDMLKRAYGNTIVKYTISEAIRKLIQTQEEIIRQAFLNHFGFPIDNVLHDGDLTIVIKQNSAIKRFCYKNECYLIWDESDGLKIEDGVNYSRFTLTAKYLMT